MGRSGGALSRILVALCLILAACSDPLEMAHPAWVAVAPESPEGTPPVLGVDHEGLWNGQILEVAGQLADADQPVTTLVAGVRIGEATVVMINPEPDGHFSMRLPWGGEGTVVVFGRDAQGHEVLRTIEPQALIDGPPVCVITAPQPEDQLPIATASLFAGLVTDPEGQPVTYSWSISGLGQISTEPQFLFAPPPGNFTIELEGTDVKGQGCEASVKFGVAP
jgi:hypothetical protein